jgi:sporulation protein YlmC with PRC-barrel domain
MKSSIHAVDGDIGTLKDIYFDDANWAVRYLVVDTGHWLPGRKVLLSPYSLSATHHGNDGLPLKLSKEQIRNSPEIDSDKPVSRQQEEKLGVYYGWPPIPPALLIGGGMLATGYTYTGAHYAQTGTTKAVPPEVTADYDPHLRSMREIVGYTVVGFDGEIGYVEDFVLDLENLRVTSLLVDTHGSAVGLILPSESIHEIRWEARTVTARGSRSGREKVSTEA